MRYILEFISVLIWQAILCWTLIYFRKEISRLIRRIRKGKVGGSEFEFDTQLPSPTSKEIKSSDDDDFSEDLVDENGFLTRSGIEKAVTMSSSRLPGEEPFSSLLVYSTSKQSTWLVATNHHIYCVLDGDKTRDSGRLLQWRLPLDKSFHISAYERNARTGLFTLGPKKNWLYSRKLFTNPEQLETAVRSLIDLATKESSA